MKIALPWAFFLSVILMSCSKEEKEKIIEAPPLTDSLTTGYHTLYFTIFYPSSDLEDWLNRKLARVVVDKMIPREQNKDSVRLIITRPKNIRLKTVGDSVDITLPLEIEVIADKERKSGKVASRRVMGELDLFLNIKPDLDRNWNIRSTSTLKDHLWISQPRLQIGNAEIGIKFLVDHILKKELGNLTDALEKVDLERGLNRTWSNLQKPMPISYQDSSRLYFAIDPKTIAGDIQITPGGFAFRMAVKTRSLVQVDSVAGKRHLPPFQRLKTFQPDSNRLEVLATIPLTQLNRELTRLVESYAFENAAMHLTLKGIEMKGSGDKIALHLDVEGTAKGTVTVLGKPLYLPQERLLTIQELNYELETDQLLLRLLNKTLKDNLLNYVSQKVILDVGKYVDSLPAYLNNTINQGRTGDKFYMNFDEIVLEDISYVVNETDFQIKLLCRPKFDISLKKLPVKKQLRIR